MWRRSDEEEAGEKGKEKMMEGRSTKQKEGCEAGQKREPKPRRNDDYDSMGGEVAICSSSPEYTDMKESHAPAASNKRYLQDEHKQEQRGRCHDRESYSYPHLLSSPLFPTPQQSKTSVSLLCSAQTCGMRGKQWGRFSVPGKSHDSESYSSSDRWCGTP